MGYYQQLQLVIEILFVVLILLLIYLIWQRKNLNRDTGIDRQRDYLRNSSRLTNRQRRHPISSGNVCPYCYARNGINDVYCQRCGQTIGGWSGLDIEEEMEREPDRHPLDDLQPVPRSMKDEYRGVYGCPNCLETLPVDSRECHMCGSTFWSTVRKEM